MASDEIMTFHSSLQDEDFDNDIDDGYEDHHHPHNSKLSRLSVCSSSTMCGVDDDHDVDDDALAMYMSGLFIESFKGDYDDADADADGEFSDAKELHAGLSSDSENELGSCYSLPATPPRRRNQVKDYASDNEVQKGVLVEQKTKKNGKWRSSRRCRRVRKNNAWGWDSSEKSSSSKGKMKEEENVMMGFSGESDQSGSTVIGTGLRVITRPKGGRRSLCMDLEEVKACRDLGFELEMPSRLSVSLSNSTLDTSSGGNSPIANWRISSPGDDPRDVKARLKMWAQAVAASASKYGT